MALRKRNPSTIFNKSKVRFSGVQQIDSDKGTVINYGSTENLLTKQEYDSQINLVESKNTAYNRALETADRIHVDLKDAEKKLSGYYTQILASAKGKYGIDSTEYMMLGGTRVSDRKKRQPKNKNAVK
ncbi:MAG: hypothetical protein ABI840_01040 [bacterium]